MCYRHGFHPKAGTLACWLLRYLGRIAVAASVASVFVSSTLIAQPLPQSVLIVDQYAASLPWVAARNSQFRTLLNVDRVVRISIYEEYLDFNRFAGPQYKASVRLHFREKYRDKAIGLIVAFGPLALDYAVDMRAELWPKAAVVFGEVADTAINRSSLPAAVTGTTINITFGEMVIAARALVPDLKHIALVGDLLENLPAYRHFKEEIPRVAHGFDVIDLTGLTMEDLRKRVAVLPGQTAIIYTTINLDRAGVSYVPAEALSLVAQVANRPIVISTETFLGRGAVGGFVVTPQAVGQDAARLALRILDGEDASSIAATVSSTNKPIFDWRQLQRWGISESALPPDSEVRFRVFTVWEQYRFEIAFIVLALLLQAALISWLIYEHRRRSAAEVRSRSAMAQLAHLNRLETAGQLSASIAHEINQPVSGIALQAAAALRWLAVEKPDVEKVRDILTNISGAAHRAGDIIAGVRAMFKKDTNEKAAINLNNVINTVLALLQLDLQKEDVRVETSLEDQLPAVTGDPVQLQQVILNLIVNAAEAMLAVQSRALRIQSRSTGAGTIRVSIEDTGAGINESDRARIFDPMFTTKATGMGMGLSICRSIIENHGGKIWVEPAPVRGAVFQFELPVVSASNSQERLAA
jgi:signal transduction histidine kinase